MRTYADARHCPDCGSPLPDDPQRCPSCGLSLVGPVAASLFATFQKADQLLAQLRAQPATAGLPLATPLPATAAAVAPTAPPRPDREPRPGASGVAGAVA